MRAVHNHPPSEYVPRVVADGWDLVGIPLFDSLSEPDVSVVAGWMHVQNASEGVRLAGEGAPGYLFFVIAEGSASVASGGSEIAKLGPGDFFGEMAILGDGRRSATVTTTSPSKLLVMFGTEFRRLQDEYPAISERIHAELRRRATAGS